jgi:hypothetical protein
MVTLWVLWRLHLFKILVPLYTDAPSYIYKPSSGRDSCGYKVLDLTIFIVTDSER